MIPSQATIREAINKHVVGAVEPRHTDSGHFYCHVPTGVTAASVTTMTSFIDSPHLKTWAANCAIDVVKKNIGDIINSPEKREDIYKAAVLSHKELFTDAGDIGSVVHDVIERYIHDWLFNGKPGSTIEDFIRVDDSRVFAATRSAQCFLFDKHVMPVYSEMRVFNVKKGYGGTLDLIAYVAIPRGHQKKGHKHNTDGSMCSLWNASSKDSSKMVCNECDMKFTYELSLIDWKTSNTVNNKFEYAMQVSAYLYAFKEMTGIKPKNCFIVQLSKERNKYTSFKVGDVHKAFKAFIHASNLYEYIVSDKKKVSLTQEKTKYTFYE